MPGLPVNYDAEGLESDFDSDLVVVSDLGAEDSLLLEDESDDEEEKSDFDSLLISDFPLLPLLADDFPPLP